jgi:H+/Cl- antiporter ClcA
MDNVLKLSVFGIAIGIVVGIIDLIFGFGLNLVTEIRLDTGNLLLIILPLVGVLTMFLYQKYLADDLSAMQQIREASGRIDKDIPIIMVPLVIVTTWLSHLAGASVGREGVAIQTGATVSHYLSKRFKEFLPIPNLNYIALITGIAAGFAGLFGTPLAAIFFALEILYIKRIDMIALLPATLASLSAGLLQIWSNVNPNFWNIDYAVDLNINNIFSAIVLGLIFGVTGNVFVLLLELFEKIYDRIQMNPYLKVLIPSVVVMILLYLFNGRYSGLGLNLINAAYYQELVNSYDFLLKLLFTTVLLAIGFKGGEITPLFAIGATLGAVIAPILGFDPTLALALGYIGVFGSATNTFIAPALIGIEVFGQLNAIYFIIVALVAYLVDKEKSIY